MQTKDDVAGSVSVNAMAEIACATTLQRRKAEFPAREGRKSMTLVTFKLCLQRWVGRTLDAEGDLR